MLNPRNLALDGRPFDRLRLTREQKMAVLTEFTEQSEHPVYSFNVSPPSLDDEYFGPYYKVGTSKGGRRDIRVDPAFLAFFRRIASDQSETDGMTILQRETTIAQVAKVLSLLVPQGESDEFPELAADLNLASQHFEGMLARIRSLDDYRSADDEQILALIERAETLWRPTDRRSSHAALYLLKGRVLKRLGRTREAVEAFERSLDIQSSPKRDTRRELATLNVSVS